MNTHRHQESGTTLVEVMLAAAVLLMMVLVLLEGLLVSARITKENSEHLAADAFAYDTAWRFFNWRFTDLVKCAKLKDGEPIDFNVASNAAPVIYNAANPAVCSVYLSATPDEEVCTIAVDVSWGRQGHTKKLSKLSGGRLYTVTRCAIERGTD